MTTGRTSPENRPLGEGPNKLRAIQDQTHQKLDEMRENMTLGQWIEGARKRIVASGAIKLASQAENSVGRLPESAQSEWRGHMQQLQQLSTRPMAARNGLAAGNGDPIAIPIYIRGILPQLAILKNLAMTGGNEGFITAVQKIEEACMAYIRAIGSMHRSQASFFNQHMQTWSPGRTREGQLLTGGIAIVAGAAAIGTGILAFFAKDDEANWTLPAGYAVAAFAAGYGETITRTGTQTLELQVAFVRGADFQALRKQYRISGADWAQLTRRYYQVRTTDGPVRDFLKNRNQRDAAQVKRQRAAILALAPAGIQQQVQDMLDSGSGTSPGRDFRNFASLLNNATSPFAQGAVFNFITGSTVPGRDPPPRLPPGTAVA